MKKIIKILIIICSFIFILTCAINLIVISKSNNYINKNIDYNDYDYVIVLGAKVTNNTPSLMLKDRLDKALELYNKNNNIKIIVSGDSQDINEYDEVSVMKNYLLNNNVNSENIIEDIYGISTYDSIVRMKDIIKNKKIIIVTQKYHLYRSVFIAKEYNIDCIGISAKEVNYFGFITRELREKLARVKDYFLTKLKIEPKYN